MERTRLVFDLRLFRQERLKRGYSNKQIAKQVREWASACDGLTPKEIMQEYKFFSEREWLREEKY